jgi:hypothetical protein
MALNAVPALGKGTASLELAGATEGVTTVKAEALEPRAWGEAERGPVFPPREEEHRLREGACPPGTRLPGTCGERLALKRPFENEKGTACPSCQMTRSLTLATSQELVSLVVV